MCTPTPDGVELASAGAETVTIYVAASLLVNAVVLSSEKSHTFRTKCTTYIHSGFVSE